MNDVLNANGDKQRWSGMTIDELITEAKSTLQAMFRATFEAVKILRYIEYEERWFEMASYADKSFRTFLEEYFGISHGTYENMKAMAVKHGPELFNAYGHATLKKLEAVPNGKKKALLDKWEATREKFGQVPIKTINKDINDVLPKRKKKKHFDTFCPCCKKKISVVKKTGEVLKGWFNKKD